jgi:hypothetical protein
MFSGIETMLVNLAIGSALTKLALYGAGVNWAEVENDATQAINKLMPSAVVDSMIDPYVVPVIQTIAKALQDTAALKGIVTLCEAANWTAAYAAVVLLIKNDAPAPVAALLPGA